MRFPSILNAARRAQATAARFPLAILSGLVASGALVALIAASGMGAWKTRLVATAALGLPLFTVLALTAERRAVPPPRRWLPAAVLLPTLVLLFIVSLGWTDELAVLRLPQLLLVGHLAVLPYLGDRGLGGFWQYNRMLLLNFLLAGVYTVVLWVGLSVAVLAVNQLFAVRVPGEERPMNSSRRRASPLCSAPLVLPWLLLLLGCGDSADEALLGDLSFRITQECSDDGATCEPVCEDTDCDVCDEGQPPSMGGCWITGIGFLTDSDGRDNFGGNGMPMKAGYIRGEWEHDDHATGDKFHGRVTYLYCRHVDEPGPGQPSGPDHNFTINQAYYGGPGRWFEPGVGWQDGYWFDVMAEDHGEPGRVSEEEKTPQL